MSRFDEASYKTRPTRRKSRPRTKDRPEHAGAALGWVTAIDRGRYTVLMNENESNETTLSAMKARELGRMSIVVGDTVSVVGDISGNPGSLARIVRCEPRRNVLRRTADDTTLKERFLVANVDQVMVVCATKDPEPRARLVDRCLVAGADAGIRTLLCMTKADLADPAEFASLYEGLDLTVLTTKMTADGGHDTAGLESLREACAGKRTVLIGHSGVGKSTLVNALVPGAYRATGATNVVTGRGRHTSSSAVALRLHDAHGAPCGWVIDTPGVRSFGLAHVQPHDLLATFPDLAPGEEACPRGCTHDEEECGLDPYVASGAAGSGGAQRLDSFRRLLRTLVSAEEY